MSEGSGIHQVSTPESQSIKGCAELREKCQEKIFNKMDDLHDKQMNAIGGIDKKIAFMEGAASAQPSKPVTSRNNNGKKELRQFLIQALIQWGPVFLLIMLLGLREWLKSKGWM